MEKLPEIIKKVGDIESKKKCSKCGSVLSIYNKSGECFCHNNPPNWTLKDESISSSMPKSKGLGTKLTSERGTRTRPSSHS